MNLRPAWIHDLTRYAIYRQIANRMRISSTKHLRTPSAQIIASHDGYLSAATITDSPRRRMKKKKTESNDVFIRTTNSDVLQFHGNQGPFGRCRGDCDSSIDCMPGLVCFQRDGAENNVPGCDGVAVVDVDYCVLPSDISDEQREGSGTIPNADLTSPNQISSPAPTATPPTGETEPSPSPPTYSPLVPTLLPGPSPTSPAPSTSGNGLVTDSPTFRVTFGFDDDEDIVSITPTPSPTVVSPTTDSKVIAAINTGDELTSSQIGANTFDITSPSGYAVMAFAFLSLLVLAIVGLALRNRKKRAAVAEIKNKPSLSTVIVPFDDGREGSPRWGDGSTINQLTHAFDSENMGIEVIDIKSRPSADSFDAEPNDPSLHKKYPKFFGLPERDENGEVGPMDTIDL